MKKLFALLIAVMMVITLVACGSTASSSSQDETKDEKTTLIVGLDDSFPPMGFRDENNNIVGFDIDLVVEAAKRCGLEAVLTPIDWSTKELELDGGKVDVLWNGLTITDARKESMLMSPAYVANAQVVVVKADSGIETIADLADKIVAYQEGSSAEDAYKNAIAEINVNDPITATDNVTLFNDLKIGRINAVVIDKVFAEYYIATDTDGVLTILDEELEDEEYGIAFKKGNDELADKVLSAFMEMVNDGTAATISQKWFGEDRIIFDYTN